MHPLMAEYDTTSATLDAWDAGTLAQAIGGLVDWLQRANLCPGQRIALLGPVDRQAALLCWALWQLGVVVRPLNPRFPEPLLQALLQDCDGLISPRPVPVQPCPWLAWPQGLSLERRRAVLPWHSLPPEQPLCEILTSGSSGQPKAVLHSWKNYSSSAQGSYAVLPLQPGDTWLVALPLFHVGGLAILVRTALAGACAVFPAPAQSLAEALEAIRPSHLSLVPTQLYRLLQDARNWSALQGCRAILLGGAAVSPALVERSLALGLRLHTSYGSTEMSSLVCATRAGASHAELLTAGSPLPGREVWIRPDGEIWVRGDTRFLGYVSGEGLVQPFTAEGWYASGDLGCWTPEGGLRVLGRRDHRFNCGGEKVQPEQVEQVLLSWPGMRQALVVPIPDPEYGHRPVAFVDCTNDYTEADLRRFVRSQLPGYMVPVKIFPWPSLPETGLKPGRAFFQSYAQSLI